MLHRSANLICKIKSARTTDEHELQADSENSRTPEEDKVVHRRATAAAVPFLLRAWWLRDFEESSDIDWHESGYVTGPIWSLHSDPLCDASAIDSPE